MVAQHVTVTPVRLLNLDSHKVTLYGSASVAWHFSVMETFKDVRITQKGSN